MMQNCDTEYENASKRANTAIEIVQVIDAHTECYKAIVSEIITAKYKQEIKYEVEKWLKRYW